MFLLGHSHKFIPKQNLLLPVFNNLDISYCQWGSVYLAAYRELKATTGGLTRCQVLSSSMRGDCNLLFQGSLTHSVE